jgi:hypothetical protein
MATPAHLTAGAYAELKEHVRSTIVESWYKGANDALLALLELQKADDGFGRKHVAVSAAPRLRPCRATN